jgi:beta-glucosidase
MFPIREHQYKDEVITTINNNRTRLKNSVLYGIDAVHGASYTAGATLFPQQIGMAATLILK